VVGVDATVVAVTPVVVALLPPVETGDGLELEHAATKKAPATSAAAANLARRAEWIPVAEPPCDDVMVCLLSFFRSVFQ
jgi:hypothetical protein